MTIQITGKNLDIGAALREYAASRLDELLGKYVGSEHNGHIRIEKTGNIFHTNCTAKLKSGLVLNSHGDASDPHVSVDMALDKLAKRMRRHKRRLHDHHSRHANGKWAALEATDYVLDGGGGSAGGSAGAGADGDEEEEAPAPAIIAETRAVIRQMAVSDAVMDLDLAGGDFLLFKNAAHGRINIVYRRSDGNIGWIDPSE
jgi:ribosomal subunit interface protein